MAISATNSLTTNDSARSVDPFVHIGVAESVIPTLLLPQAETARDAVRLLGHYLDECGASDSNGIVIGDPMRHGILRSAQVNTDSKAAYTMPKEALQPAAITFRSTKRGGI